MASDQPEPTPPSDSDEDSEPATRILRRAPLSPPRQDPPTTILRRHPTGPLPTPPRATPTAIAPSGPTGADPRAAIATAVLSIVSGWASAVIATNLIAGWWSTDPLFCVAMGFLTAVAAAAGIGGVIALLMRRRPGRLLIVVGSVIGLLIVANLFVAGATLSPVVYAIPALPLATIALALLPATKRWARPAR